MNESKFKKTDESMMEKMKPVRERRVAPEFLKGFAASVVRRLPAGRQGIESREQPAPVQPFRLQTLVPVFAVLILAFVVVLRLPGGSNPAISVPTEGVVEVAQLPEPTQNVEVTLVDEIAALRKLGVWTDEDEVVAGVSAEEEAEIEEVLA